MKLELDIESSTLGLLVGLLLADYWNRLSYDDKLALNDELQRQIEKHKLTKDKKK